MVLVERIALLCVSICDGDIQQAMKMLSLYTVEYLMLMFRRNHQSKVNLLLLVFFYCENKEIYIMTSDILCKNNPCLIYICQRSVSDSGQS